MKEKVKNKPTQNGNMIGGLCCQTNKRNLINISNHHYNRFELSIVSHFETTVHRRAGMPLLSIHPTGPQYQKGSIGRFQMTF